jgi:GxxExxY protein
MARDELLHERLTESIIGAFYRVYNELGYGFLEKVYARALEIELWHRGIAFQREMQVDIYYRTRYVTTQRVDLLVLDKVVVEVKAGEILPMAAAKQCRSYLKALNLEVGVILNFGEKPQIKRIVYRGSPMGPAVEARIPKSAGPDPGPAHLPEGKKV